MKNNCDELSKKEGRNHSVSIEGNANGIQIQQNVSNSTQSQSVNETFDYEKILEVLQEVLKFEHTFKDTYGHEAEHVLELLDKAKQAAVNKEEPSKIKSLLNTVKDISLRVTSSLVSTGIIGLLSQIGI